MRSLAGAGSEVKQPDREPRQDAAQTNGSHERRETMEEVVQIEKENPRSTQETPKHLTSGYEGILRTAPGMACSQCSVLLAAAL